MDERITQLRKGALDLAVLALLAETPRYGGALVESLQAAGLEVSTGTIYPILTRLKKAELVQTHWEESPFGPPRKFYTLTDDGQRELVELADAWRSLNRTIDGLLAANTPGTNTPATSTAATAGS
ncbi:PadR family transcriptional regulator [Luteococcus sp. H138]|uniref:PadR family transcriptional regulator n=1 Tax=unclassified Luteococcus TaxID=2639923 RepID=UPI00313D0A38